MVVFTFFFQGSQVRAQVPEYGSKFPNTGQLYTLSVQTGVRVQVPEYGSRFPSTGQGKPILVYVVRIPSTGHRKSHLLFRKKYKKYFFFIYSTKFCNVLFCHVPWVIGFESYLKKIDFRWRY